MTDDCNMILSKDLDVSNPKNVTLTASGQGRICATCVCQQKATDFYAIFANCTDGSGDAATISLAKNVHTFVEACP